MPVLTMNVRSRLSDLSEKINTKLGNQLPGSAAATSSPVSARQEILLQQSLKRKGDDCFIGSYVMNSLRFNYISKESLQDIVGAGFSFKTRF